MRGLKLGAAAVAVGLLAAACSSSSSSSKSSSGSTGTTTGANPAASSAKYSASHPLKIGFILQGPVTDGGFNSAIYAGIKQMQQQYGSAVQVTYKENVPETPQSSQVIDSLIQDGNEAIVTTSFGFHTYAVQAAQTNPKVSFMQWESTETAPNLSEYYFDIDESWYLAGLAAGAATKNGKIGMLASFPIPGVLVQVDGFALGVAATNPTATVRVVWLNSFYDPPKATEAAKSLVSSGADTLANVLDDASVVQVAESNKLPVVGHDLDQEKFGPTSWLTGANFVFGPYFTKQVGDLINGQWKGNDNYIGDSKDGSTTISPFGPRYTQAVPTDVQAKIQQRQDQFKAGTFNVWTGPISDQSGAVQVPDGQSLTPVQQQQIHYLVKNVLGTITK